MRLCDILTLCQDHEGLVKFLKDRHVLMSEVKCPKCAGDMVFTGQSDEFRCRKRSLVLNSRKKKVSQQCNTHISVYHGSWFSDIRIPISEAVKFIGFYVFFNPPRQQFLEYELKMSPTTVVDWSSFLREVMTLWCEDHSQRIGGVGITVEIDETKIGHRKYNRGRIVDGRWVFGAIERHTKKIFVTTVPDRTADTLVDVIRKWILPGTTIISDMWKAYNRLEHEVFRHLTVNHSINFVDPVTQAHTQNIERTWRDLKEHTQRYGTKDEHYEGYLCEFMFKHSVEFNNRFGTIIDTIAKHFPPHI